MKDGIQQIVGKQIAGIVVAESDHDPSQQVFLVFGDGTTFEFYGKQFNCCGGLDNAASLARYIQSGGARVKKMYPAATATASANDGFEEKPAEGSLEDLLQRDLDAWKAAKAAVERARRC